jgi:hypothetical protein
MNGKRLGTLLLAGSLGLNVALGAVIISQVVAGRREISRSDWDRSRRGREQRGRSDWQSRFRAESDTTRSFPRLEREQINQLREMRRQYEELITPLREEINTLQSSIREELDSEEPDFELLDGIAEQIAGLQASIQKHSFRLIAREREILTPEQFRAFTRMMMPGRHDPDDSNQSGRSRHRTLSGRDSSRSTDRPPNKSSRDSRNSGNDPPPHRFQHF